MLIDPNDDDELVSIAVIGTVILIILYIVWFINTTR